MSGRGGFLLVNFKCDVSHTLRHIFKSIPQPSDVVSRHRRVRYDQFNDERTGQAASVSDGLEGVAYFPKIADHVVKFGDKGRVESNRSEGVKGTGRVKGGVFHT